MSGNRKDLIKRLDYEPCNVNYFETHFKLPSKASSSNAFCFIFFYRVNDYSNNGLSNNLVDPDGGVNLQKNRLKLGLIQEVNPTCNAEFPTDGFQVGISCVPRIGYNHIWKYLIKDVEFKKQLFVEKAYRKRLQLFQVWQSAWIVQQI